ncbi:MAG TPA: hypothetical protein VEI57_09320 [Nitrospirota bacterium]|nr:hypothetical protein [Nitrospirota bacterium]
MNTVSPRAFKTILFVNCEAEARDIFCELGSDRGYNSIYEPHGLSALSIIWLGGHYGRVINDYRMPVVKASVLSRP